MAGLSCEACDVPDFTPAMPEKRAAHQEARADDERWGTVTG